jgi:hypothetical protein
LDTVFLHNLPEILSLLGLDWDLSRFWVHASVAILALSVPALFPLLAYGIIRLIYTLTQKIQPRSFVELAYGYLPLVLAANLAYYLQLGLGEGGRILPVAMATFGFSGNSLPVFVAHPAVISFLQGTTLIAGMVLAILLSQKIARQSFNLLLPQHLATLGLGLVFWWVIL